MVDTRPRSGLSVPVVTVLDDYGHLVEADQRAVVRYVVQRGHGADIVFSAGTTGEWDRIDQPTRRCVTQICCDEVSRQNRILEGDSAQRIEAWAGVTAPTAGETLENLDFAIECGADAAVLAPLSIAEIDDPVRFVARDVADLMDASRRRIPVYLYDNADIAVDPKVPHIRTRQVKAMSRLDFVRGIKVSAGPKVLGNYTRAAESFRERGEFAIYVGRAMLIFDLFRPRAGPTATLVEHWKRRRRRGSVPMGVVAGPANALPREWARAWQVCRAGDLERMEQVRRVLEAFAQATEGLGGERSTIACLKRALFAEGIISSPAVARGTPALSTRDAQRFEERYEQVKVAARAALGPSWASVPPG